MRYTADSPPDVSLAAFGEVFAILGVCVLDPTDQADCAEEV
jgi:hypothetical protein